MPLTIGRKLGHVAIGACVALISEAVRADPLPPTMQDNTGCAQFL